MVIIMRNFRIKLNQLRGQEFRTNLVRNRCFVTMVINMFVAVIIGSKDEVVIFINFNYCFYYFNFSNRIIIMLKKIMSNIHLITIIHSFRYCPFD